MRTTVTLDSDFCQPTYDLGPPLVDLTKAASLAAELEDRDFERCFTSFKVLRRRGVTSDAANAVRAEQDSR